MSAIVAIRQRAHDIRMLGPSALLAFVVLWGALITWLSAQPSRHEPPSGFTVHLLFNSGHAPLFGFWAGGLAFFLGSRAKRPIPDLAFGIVAVGAAVLFGIADEWHQSFVPGRTSSWTDVVTDGFGAAITILVLRYLASPRATVGGFLLRAILGIGLILVVGAGVTEADSQGIG